MMERCPHPLTFHMARSRAVYSHRCCSVFSSPSRTATSACLCSSELMAASSTCVVSRQGQGCFLSFFVISSMPTTVYFWHTPSLWHRSSSIDSQMLHAGLASLLASRRPRSCCSQQTELVTIPVIKSGETVLKVVDKFCYLGNVLSSDAGIDDDIGNRLGKAGAAFGRLTKRLWDDHGIRLSTKIAVYRAVVLTTLLYGCETWTLYRCQILKLDQFHMRCLRKIANIKWQEMIPNTSELERCQISGIEAFLMTAQFRWTGHVIRMEDDRIPKRTLYGQLADGARSTGGQLKRFKDSLKANLKMCNISPMELESLARDRSHWRASCSGAVAEFEDSRIRCLQDKRQRRKFRSMPGVAVASAPHGQFGCDVCGRICASRIGLISHRRTHR